MNNFESWFQRMYPQLPLQGARAVLELMAEGSTIPFIARYRKEKTGNLDEVAIALCVEAGQTFEALQKRKDFVLKEIEAQGKLSDALKKQIVSADDLLRIEDLYLPYKKKRKTKAQKAKEAGLEPVASWVWDRAHGTIKEDKNLDEWASSFISKEKELEDLDAVMKGVQAILVERVSEDASLRAYMRTVLQEQGSIHAEKTDDAPSDSKYDMYFSYSEAVSSLLQASCSHRYLAIRRGTQEGHLRMSVGNSESVDELVDLLVAYSSTQHCPESTSSVAALMNRAIRLAVKVYMLPSLEKELHNQLKEAADEAAISVFAENVKTVLLESPFGSKTVLGVDPGLRTGCKLALIDRSGKFIADTVVYLHTDEGKQHARAIIQKLITSVSLEGVAVGNGTAGRETHVFLQGLLKDLGCKAPVVLVSESGASIYSASEIARKEFPDLDLTVRGAISIARRFQDPLAELVKVDPKSIGVGQYQHDVSQPRLKDSLQRVVESCVNSVGVNVNTASEYLLSFVSGISATVARNVVKHRESKGLFHSRDDLRSVSGFGDRTFEQAAGFLRIPDALDPLDNTGVHPERYAALKEAAKRLGLDMTESMVTHVERLKQDVQLKETVGDFTFHDMLEELSKPGRDPRESFEVFEFGEGIHKIEDLSAGMICPGIVSNVTNFGAFVDLGVKQDGFIHISQLSNSFVEDPSAIVSPGQKVKVKVLDVDLGRQRISLSMKLDEAVGSQSKRRDASTTKGAKQQSKSSRQDRGNQGNRGSRRPKTEDSGSLSQTPFAGLSSLISG